MKPTVILAACVLLAACNAKAVNGPPGDNDRGGGSAATQGKLYCQTIPKSIYDRAEWNRICKPFD